MLYCLVHHPAHDQFQGKRDFCSVITIVRLMQMQLTNHMIVLICPFMKLVPTNSACAAAKTDSPTFTDDHGAFGRIQACGKRIVEAHSWLGGPCLFNMLLACKLAVAKAFIIPKNHFSRI